jgi:glycosyltransferase involved in cell wall biosynthesis
MANHYEAKSAIKLCIIAPSLDITGGQSRQAAKLLAAYANEPTIAADFIPHNPRVIAPLRWMQQIKYVRTVVTTLWYWALLLFKSWRYDVLQVFSASYYSYLLSVAPAILIGKLYGKRVILNYRSGEAEDHLQNWPLTTKPIMRLADRIIVPSGYLVDVFARFGLRAEIIANAVELERFRFRERTSLQPKFLCTRLFEPLYNIGNVIRAFALIQQQLPEASLTLAGDGSQRAMLEQLVKELGARKVAFRGFVKFEDMPALYDAHDVYLMANDIDNMPATLLESNASGLAVVTTDAGGVPYLVTHEQNALLVRCGDYQNLAQQALRLFTEPDLTTRLTTNGLANARQYTWPAVREQWLGLYEELTRCVSNPTMKEGDRGNAPVSINQHAAEVALPHGQATDTL